MAKKTTHSWVALAQTLSRLASRRSSSGGEMGRLPTGTVVQPPATPFRSGATVAIDLTAFNSSVKEDGALVGQ